MNKILLLSLGIAVFGYAQDHTKIGLGVATIQQPYKGTKGKVLVILYLDAKYGGFYIRGIEGGYEQKVAGEVTMGAFVKARLDGYKSSNSDDLSGMEERKYAIDGGVRTSIGGHKMGTVSAFALNDISGTYNGYELGLEYSKMFIHKKSTIIPYLSLKKESNKLTDYYYGVKSSEATLNRTKYSPKGALNTEIGIRYFYAMSSNVDLVGIASYTKLDEEIYKSPIIKDKERLKAFVASAYKF